MGRHKRPGRKPLGRTDAEIRERNRLRRAHQRDAAKARAKVAAELARERGQQRVALTEDGWVLMRLQQPIEHRTDHNELLVFPATTEFGTRPGDVIDLEARGVAIRVGQERASYGAAIITGPPPDRFEPLEPDNSRRGNTAAGY